MALVDPRLVVLAAALTVAPPGPADFPRAAKVSVESALTFAEPDVTSFTLERLAKDEPVRVLDADRAGGWLTIEPPSSAFAWVDEAALRPDGPDAAKVSAATTSLRAGIPGARLPGPQRATLKRGDTVRLLGRDPLRSSTGRTWIAVQPPSGDVRYVREQDVAWSPVPKPVTIERPTETRVRYDEEPVQGLEQVPAAIAAEIRKIEADHRAALSGPVENWQLDDVAKRYEALRKTVTDAASVSAIASRQALVSRQTEIARSARTMQTILARSRRRDGVIDSVKKRLAHVEASGRPPFAAEGLLQPSSRQVEGRRVYALIGPEGNAVAYLDVPPGLDARPMLSKRVGARGSTRYEESLRAKLVTVRELEPLER